MRIVYTDGSRILKGDGIMNKQLKAELLLLMATLFWGTSYLLTKVGLEGIAPFNLTALRFGVGFLACVILVPNAVLKADRRTVGYAAYLSAILLVVFATMTYGVQLTSVSNAGFLVSLTMVFIPLEVWLMYRRRPTRKVIIATAMATLGIALLTLGPALSVGIGDLLCIFCAISCAFHIVMTDRFTQRVDSIHLGILQVGFVALYSFIFSYALETPQLPGSVSGWIAVLGLGILCTAIGFVVQTYAQQYTSPSRAGLIFSLESVFSAIFAYLVLGEVLSARGYLGALLMFSSLVVLEWRKHPRREAHRARKTA